jgi:hypothetical protein
MFGTYARNVISASGRYRPSTESEPDPGPAATIRKHGPRISAAKIPLEGWIAHIWVETLLQWHAMSGSPVFDNPDDAIAWGLEQLKGWPSTPPKPKG